jgi:hypothetical protein
MDIEKTMEFILQSQARFEQNQARFEENHARFEQDHARAMRRMDKFDKQIKATENLVRAGMKLVLKNRAEQKESDRTFNAKLNALVDSQMRAEERMNRYDERMKKHEEWLRKHDERFERFMEMMRGRNGNGSKGRS